jgi:hypothetical protein
MFYHGLTLGAESSFVEGMGFLSPNLDHLPVSDGHFHSATVIAQGTAGKELLRGFLCHSSDLLETLFVTV